MQNIDNKAKSIILNIRSCTIYFFFKCIMQ